MKVSMQVLNPSYVHNNQIMDCDGAGTISFNPYTQSLISFRPIVFLKSNVNLLNTDEGVYRIE